MKGIDVLKKLRYSYDLIAEDFSFTRKQRPWKEVIMFIKSLESGILLDIGCGYDRYSKYFVGEYIGLDFSKGLIKQSLKDNPSNLYVVGDALEMPFKENIADAIISIAVLHHIPTKEDRKKFLKNVLSISKTKSRILISVWYKNQERFRSLPKEYDIKWRGKFFRYYYLFEFEDLVKEIFSFLGNSTKYVVFVEYKRRNLYLYIEK